MPYPLTDPVATCEAVRSWCRENKVPCASGHIVFPGALPVVAFDDEDKSLAEFLAACASSKAGAVFIDATYLTQETWDMKGSEIDDGRDRKMRRGLRSFLDEYRPFIGQIVAAEIRAIATTPPMVLGLNTAAECFEFFFDHPLEDGAPLDLTEPY